jgi:GNAT superfamily N-acetyltransferase
MEPTASKIIIRDAEAAEATKVERLVRCMLEELATMGGIPVNTDEGAWASVAGEISQAIESEEQLFLIAEQTGHPATPIGLAHASVVIREAVFEPASKLHVHGLYVEPNHRRRGIGRSLLDSAMAWGRAKGCTEAELNVLRQNPARRLYECLGFRAFQTEMVLDLLAALARCSRGSARAGVDPSV